MQDEATARAEHRARRHGPDARHATAQEDLTLAAADSVAPEAGLLGPLDPQWIASSLAPVTDGLQQHWERAAQVLLQYTANAARLILPDQGAGGGVECPVEPAANDKRFRDAAWTDNPYFRALGQGYLLWERMMHDLVDAAGLEAQAHARAQFAAKAVTDACAPTNFFWTNPEALRRAVETQGESVVQGLRNFVSDLEGNGGRPRQVDTSPFALGVNLAATAGRVVYRNDLMELIQYEPRTETVHEVPLLVSPPWINKYYILDLAPGRSFVQWAVEHGHTVFAISYRNPDATARDWSLDDYLLNGPRMALDVITDITGSEEVNIAALCVGGTLTAMLAAWLAEAGEKRVRSITLLNTLLDFDDPGALGLFTDSESVDRLVESMSEKGYLEASTMAGTFDVLRANELIWNYVSRNWLLGESPPPFDILTWNYDSTRLPAALHAFYLRACYVQNRLARGDLKLGGLPIRLAAVTSDTFVVAAQNDHIVPWRSAYRATQLLAGDVTFVLTSSGHIAGVVNPPNDRSRHWTADRNPPEPDAWLTVADEQRGSWWETWAQWAATRSDARRPPPPLGSTAYPAGAPAPGAYVHEKS